MTDRYGLELTSNSPAAVAHYTTGLDHALAGNAPAESFFERAAAADPGFALAHIGQAAMLQFRGRRAEAIGAIAQARALAPRVTRRERQHIEMLATMLDGDAARALQLVHEHLKEFPRDALVLAQVAGAFGLISFSGQPDFNEQRLALMDSLAPHYGDDWWFLGMHSFSLIELHHFEPARRKGERALVLNPGFGHGAHSVAHVHYELGDTAAGIAFLETFLATYEPPNRVFGHLYWHLALLNLALGNTRRAVEIYDRWLCPSRTTSPALAKLADAASLLWRFDLLGLTPARSGWEAVSAYADEAFARPPHDFAALHCLLAGAAVGDEARLNRLMDGFRARGADWMVTLSEALRATAAGEHTRAARLLESIAGECVRLGGSRAQRDVVEETLLESYFRAGESDRAKALLDARHQHGPLGSYRLKTKAP